MTLAQLAVTLLLLGALGLVASRFGLSAIPAYLLAGLLLGPNEPKVLSLVHPSEVTDFVAEIGIVFLLFFLGLEFSPARLLASGRHILLGGLTDLAFNGALGMVVGLVAFGPSFPALVLGAAVYVSSSAITVKGLTDFRRLADRETDLVLAILVFEDLVIALVFGLVGSGGGGLGTTGAAAGKAIGFVAVALAASRWLAEPFGALLDRLPREFFLLATVAVVVGAAALAEKLGLSEAIGALMAGVVLADTTVRDEIEERFFSFRDVFAALFFFTFGLSIDVAAVSRLVWLLALALVATVGGKLATGYLAGRAGGLSQRQGWNAGIALVAHGEFTVVLAQIAVESGRVGGADRADLVAFSGLYVLVTATVGIVLMKESKRLARLVFPAPRLTGKTS